jgi:hypothetical protein
MPDLKFITLEVLVLIVLPLLVLYLRGKWPLKTVILCLFVIPIFWYLTYAPIHELSHALGTYIAGGKVTEYKLIPNFWEGVFAVAWVRTTGLNSAWQNMAMTGAPYFLDFASILVGAVVMLRNQLKNAFLVGFLFMILCLRPTFDLVCETIGFINGFMGDLYHIRLIVGDLILTTFLVLSLGISLFLLYVIIKRYAGFYVRIDARTLS